MLCAYAGLCMRAMECRKRVRSTGRIVEDHRTEAGLELKQQAEALE